MISLNGTEGENGYYTTDVGVTITAGAATDVSRIKYKVEGANPITETESAGSNDVTFNITQDGTSTVTAYIINTAGLTSETITQVVNKDSTNPSTATIALSGEAGETTIDVTASGADATSGVASYAFQISTTGNEDDFTTQNTVNIESTTCTYQYIGLTSNTTYYLRVVIKDKAGNMVPSNIVNTTTKKSGLSEEVLASNVGAYVDYTPDVGSFSDHTNVDYSGISTSQNFTISTDTSIKWKILFTEDNKLILISDEAVHNGFTLSGENGYNNGVLLLNNACKAMYSNNNLGATGRSLNIDDIEKYMTYNKNSYIEDSYRYGNEYIPSRSYYPNIFAQEKTGAPEGKYGTKYGQSDQTEYITGVSEGTYGVFKGKWTYYTFTMSTSTMKNQIYVDLFSSTTMNWIASRCINYNANFGSWFYFRLFRVYDSIVDANGLYNSSGPSTATSFSCAVRPLVEIDLTKVNVGLTGTGADGDGYSLTLK